MTRKFGIRLLSPVVALIAATAGPALAFPTLAGIMAHSRDDLPAGFATLSGNDSTANATIPFAVVIDGTSYTTVTISTNGWLEFGGNTQGTSDPTNACLPTSKHTNPFLAFFWDDMRTINTAIRYGTVGTAPGRVFIVDANVEANFGSNHDVTMQVQIHESSNLITVKYQDTESESSGQTATIGFQGAGGASATARPLTCNGKILDDNTPLDAWSIDLGLPTGSALAGYAVSSRDDISGFTTLSGNDSTANATMPFSISIDGTSYTTVAISTNGWLEFGGNTQGTSDQTNACLPTSKHTNPFLAAYWDDMRTLGSNIRYGTVGSSPDRTFIVDFELENNFGANHNITFQVQIHERSNLVTVKYISSEAEANGQTATIGFQHAGGASATAEPITCNGKVLDDNLNDTGWSIDLGSPNGTAVHGIIDYSRDDITGFTTLSGNDSVATPSLGFTLTLDGTNYTTVAISTNGWMEFGGNTAANSHPANTCLPTASHTHHFLAAYWDDMRTLGNNIRYGTVGSSPNRVFVADFELENNFGANHNLTMQVQVHERSNLITVAYLDTEDEANGQTATIGYQGAGGASANVRRITCSGKVLDDNTTRVEGWSVSQTEVCGDGLVGPDEDCDLGASNGSATSCCTSTCAFRASGQTCRASAGTCDVAETCTGASATCPADGFASTAVVCRGAADECDAAESCPGTGPACPADAKQPAGTACTADANPCTLDQCDGTSVACQHPAGNAGSECRPAAGVCDVAETCTGTSPACPADAFEPTSTTCRPALGECDAAESCPGNGPSCPADGRVPGGSACSEDGNPCSVDECDGSSVACQHPAGNPGAVCRASAGACDPAEICTGTSTVCPADAKSSAICRPAAGVCNVAESCDGSSNDCPADAVAPSTVECRAAAGDCDLAESCDGIGVDCPPDSVASAFVVCRTAAGECDLAESCDGVSASCPGDDKKPAGTSCTDDGNVCTDDECDGTGDTCTHPAGNAGAVCRPAAGPCDVVEVCDGTSTGCPADSVAGTIVQCRAVAGECDLAESCDGASAACPADSKKPSGTPCTDDGNACTTDQCNGSGNVCPHPAGNAGAVCRPAVDACDLAETCTGLSAVCPADTTVPDGTPCTSDGNQCTADTCEAGACTHTQDVALCLDHYMCDKIKKTAGQPKFQKILNLSLVDDWENGLFDVKTPKHLCLPADKNNEGMLDAVTHLESYVIKPSVGQPLHVPHTNVVIDNQIGSLTVNTKKADLLLVPTAKSLVSDPPAPVESGHNVDHFKCYVIKVAPHTTKLPRGLTVSVADQFTAPPKTYDVKSVKKLCNAVSKNGETIKDASRHLVCYKVKPSIGQPAHTPRIGVFLHNQFGGSKVDTIKEDLLCIPSTRTP